MMSAATGDAPRVSVHMPVFNSERYLDEAVSSIRQQTFQDWELIIIDDGSTDGSLQVLQRHAEEDHRIRLLSRENRGIGATRNQCLSLARGTYFAAMDSDDISDPERLERQVEFLDANPDYVAVGSRVRLIDPEGSVIRAWSSETTHEGLDRAHLAGKGGAMVHPATMFRKSALDQLGGYRSAFDPAEDFDLFLRIAESGRIANLPGTLFSYRQHPKSVGYARREQQRYGSRKAIREAHERRGLPVPELAEQEEGLPSKSAVHEKWAWWALSDGNVSTARKHALLSVRSAPLSLSSWRAVFCSLRGY